MHCRQFLRRSRVILRRLTQKLRVNRHRLNIRFRSRVKASDLGVEAISLTVFTCSPSKKKLANKAKKALRPYRLTEHNKAQRKSLISTSRQVKLTRSILDSVDSAFTRVTVELKKSLSSFADTLAYNNNINANGGGGRELLRCICCGHELNDQHENGGYLCGYCKTPFACEGGICDFLSKKSETLELSPENSFDLLFKLESDSCWFSGRNLLIKNLISNHLPLDATILEIGC